MAGLEAHGYQLCQGDRRGFVILDHAGDTHSLARRIDGVNSKQLNTFMEGIDRAALPTVDQARQQHQEQKLITLEADHATVRQEIEWEEALAKAAIEKEKTERRFVEPGQTARETRAGQHGAVTSPQPEPVRTSPALHFEDTAREAAYDHRTQDAPDHLRGTSAEIWLAYHRSDNAKAFAAALDEKGIALAVVTKDEA